MKYLSCITVFACSFWGEMSCTSIKLNRISYVDYGSNCTTLILFSKPIQIVIPKYEAGFGGFKPVTFVKSLHATI